MHDTQSCRQSAVNIIMSHVTLVNTMVCTMINTIIIVTHYVTTTHALQELGVSPCLDNGLHACII